MAQWCVTVNLGGSYGTAEVKQSMLDWAADALLKEPAFVFAQEVPSNAWVAVWTDAGYRPFWGMDLGWKVRSLLLTHPDIPVEPLADPSTTPPDKQDPFTTLAYHGSYVAAARWRSRRGEVVLASVHASPAEADPVTYGWTGTAVAPRTGGGDPRYTPSKLWDSDLLLETLRTIAKSTPILAAGDLNESLGFDLDVEGTRLGTWGQEYFQRVKDADLTAWLHTVWIDERATHKDRQLDHVLVSNTAIDLLAKHPEPALDPAWADPSARTSLSDHTPVWFAIDDDWL